MGLFDFLHKPTSKDSREEIKIASTMPSMITIQRENGMETTAFSLNVVQRIKHRDGSISCLVSAKVLDNREGDTIFFDSGNPICFEIPEGRMDLAKSIIERNTGMQLNQSSYTYVGRAYNEEDIRLQPPSAVINNEIGKLNQILLEQAINARIEASRIEAQRRTPSRN